MNIGMYACLCVCLRMFGCVHMHVCVYIYHVKPMHGDE